MDKSMRLSQHFTLEEFTRSDTAQNRHIDNIPSLAQIENLTALCFRILEPVRWHFKRPVEIISGFRSPALNKAINGAPTSQHLNGEAADIEIAGVPNDEIWKYIHDTLPFDQLIAEKLKRNDGSAGWIHVSRKLRGEQRKDAISYLGQGKYVKGLVYI